MMLSWQVIELSGQNVAMYHMFVLNGSDTTVLWYIKYMATCNKIRGGNKAGSRASCPQNLVRAHKMLRPRAQMAPENVGLFQYLI